jgi:hypothetical protein
LTSLNHVVTSQNFLKHNLNLQPRKTLALAPG